MLSDQLVRMRQWPAIAVLVAMTAISGCESAGPYVAYDTKVLDEVQEELLKSRDAAGKSNRIEPPAAVLEALLPPITLLTEEASALEARFDFTVKEALPIRDFVNLLTVGTDLSMVVHPDTKGTISALDLKNVTVTDVLDQVSDLYGFSIVIENDVYQIRPGGLQTRIFRLNYLNVSRSGNSSMQVTASGISEGGNQNGNNQNQNQNQNNQGGNNNNAGQGNNYGNNQNNQNAGRASISTETSTDYWKGLEAVIRSIINAPAQMAGQAVGNESRSVIVSPQTGMILVRAFPSELAQVEAFIEASQEALQRQVILEAKILEVELKEGFQSGINLSALYQSGNREVSTSFGQLGSQIDGIGEPLSVDMQFSDFSGVINLLETQGNVQVVSSPRIVTLNNQKAIFKVGQEAYFLTNASTTSFGAGIEQTTSQNSSLEPFFSGIALDVTPQISEVGDIILHIHPILSEVKEDLKIINGQEFPLANSATRESDTIARVRNGEVIVISGLMQTRATGDKAGAPGLSEVPLLGSALEQKQRETVKTELVILLRALVDEGNAMEAFLDESADRVGKIRRSIDPYYRGSRE
ncbi:MAG: pilus (MSHA type) biogenesis protein MshL [Gammaproteobacteria bacterium]|nr:pilus (MSHA type) biogenesis protein MshL [Gammaproteobacteria bacterium]